MVRTPVPSGRHFPVLVTARPALPRLVPEDGQTQPPRTSSHGGGGLCAAHDRSRWLHAALRPRKRLVGLGLSFNRSQRHYRPSLGTWSVVWRSPEALPPDPYPWRPAGPEQVVGAQ